MICTKNIKFNFPTVDMDSEPASFRDQKDPVHFNRKAWNDMAVAGDKFYVAATPEQIKEAKNGVWNISVTPQKPVPRDWLEPIRDRQVLLLAGGGGQQAPILAAAGAKVTVFDLSELQLRHDQEIAAQQNLEIKTVAGGMTNLSCFDNARFDLIVNPCSTCYCPDVQPVWNECSRVLRPGGSLITGFINPVYYLFDALEMDRNRLVVRHRIPYSDFDLPDEERASLLGDRPREFGHSLDQLIGLQIEAGFVLTGFYQDTWGGNDKLSTFIDLFCATKATKRIQVLSQV